MAYDTDSYIVQSGAPVPTQTRLVAPADGFYLVTAYVTANIHFPVTGNVEVQLFMDRSTGGGEVMSSSIVQLPSAGVAANMETSLVVASEFGLAAGEYASFRLLAFDDNGPVQTEPFDVAFTISRR